MNGFAIRTAKEILRDPLSIFFGIGFPVVLLLLLTFINQNVPNDLFNIESLTPGIVVFGLSFMSLFSAQLIAKDRASSLLDRLFTTPMKATDYIIGYTLPLLPMALLQSLICYVTAILLGLKITFSLLSALLLVLPIAFIFIGIGLLCGSLLSEKAVAGLCGALLTNITAWFSGAWFDLHLVGGTFKSIAYMLPFVHAVESSKAVLSGNLTMITPHIWWVLAYGLVFIVVAIVAFNKVIRSN